jgi:transcriptional regulator with XRE-family HTH domain
MDETQSGATEQGPLSVGARLAAARLAQDLSLEDIAARSRIPLRHLRAIEAGDHSALPAATYSVGFVRTYAGLVGLDSVVLARDFRAEIGSRATDHYAYEPFEPADPARVPSRFLAFTALVIALVLLAGYLAFRGGVFGGDTAEQQAILAAGVEPPVIPAPAAAPPQAAVPVPAAPGATAPAGVVLLTATEPVWLRVSEPDGTRLIEKEMAPGESWQVPATANDPRILTGRPQALRVTVGATPIPPLGPPEQTIRDVSLAPASLLARAAQATGGPTTNDAPAAAPPVGN